MLVLLLWITNKALPRMCVYANALAEPVMEVSITLAGIAIIFGVFGINIFSNIMKMVVGGTMKAIGYLVRTTIQAIGWFVRNTLRMIPRVFQGSRRAFAQMGMSPLLSNVLAIIVVIIFIAIIV